MHTHTETRWARRDDAQNPETQAFLGALRRHLRGELSEPETEDLARTLEAEIRFLAHREENLPWADRADIAQHVLSELFTKDSLRERLEDIADADDLEFLHRVRGRLRLSVKSRVADRARYRRRRGEVDLTAAANVSIERHATRLPSLEQVLVALADSSRLPGATPFERLVVTYMLSHGRSMRAAASAYRVPRTRITSAMRHVSLLLQREFDLE